MKFLSSMERVGESRLRMKVEGTKSEVAIERF